MHRSSILLGLVVCVALLHLASASVFPCNTTTPTRSGDGWEWYCCGDCTLSRLSRLPLNRVPFGSSNVSLMLHGGGNDVDDSFTWALRRQQNAPPVVTILRSHGGTGYIPYIAGMTPTPKSVSTFVVHSRAGSEDPFVLDWIDQTTTLFFAGGFQNEYWDFWGNTTLSFVINNLIHFGTGNPNAPFTIGGTSAGLDILGQYVNVAHADSVTSAEALANPYNYKIELGTKFMYIDILKGVITDAHVLQEDRMGRICVFLGRLMKDYNLKIVRAIAGNEASALDVDETGVGFVTTDHKHTKTNGLYMMTAIRSPQDIILPNTPATLGNPILVQKIKEGNGFDLNKWAFVPGREGTQYTLTVTNGQLSVQGNDGNVY